MSSAGPEPFEPRFDPGVVEEMRARLRATRWPPPVAGADGWEWGVDLAYLRSLCAWWADEYDPEGLLERLSDWQSLRWEGIHLQHGCSHGDGVPVLLIHGWPGAPLEFRAVSAALVAAGHDVVVPSLPGYGFSAAGRPPLSAVRVAARFADLMAALGYDRYAVQGGDWGALIGSRLAFADADHVAGFHCNAPGLMPLPPDLGEPGQSELSDAELEFGRAARGAQRSVEGLHVLVQGRGPDVLGVGLGDSPAGLAAWLLPRYRLLSDCDGELERSFQRRDLCDLLTFYWATGTAASALRLYMASARDPWFPRSGERIEVPVAIADFPREAVRPPREWTERLCSDLRRWTEMPRGGHFAAWEEPGLLADDLIAFLATV